VRGHKPPRLVIASKVELGPAFRFARWSKSGLTLRQGANPNDRLLLARVAEILARRRSLLCKFLVPNVLGALSAACFVALFFAVDPYGGYLFFCAVGLLVLAGIASDIHSGFGSTLNLAHRHKTSPFLAKHAEKIIYSAGGALAGAVATHLVQEFFK
jgi:hypothetical protein